MDLWVIAAATGVGYIAKYWQNLTGEKDVSIDSSEPLDLLNHRLAHKLDEIDSVSGSDGKVSVNLDNYEGYNVLSLASLPPCLGETTDEGYGNQIWGENDPFAHSRERRTFNGFLGKPLTSLESCLTAQLNREEYVYGNFSPSTRPLLVIDESKTNSRRGNNGNSLQFDDGEDEPKQRSGDMNLSRFGGPLLSQGSSNGMLLFFVGITMGIMSATASNKREVDKLNNLLKQSENLVEDLHDELEMKDALTVRELKSSSFDLNSLDSSFKRELGRSKSYESKDPDDMDKIEAELEAELERLELNMNAYNSDKVSDFIEIDPGFEADVVHGELILNSISMHKTVDGSSSGSGSGSDCDDAGTARSWNYAVSPMDLSLRLHEVIESRLEARIRELETALENSRKKLMSNITLEPQPKISRRDLNLTYSEVGSSSTPESPTFADRPLMFNVSRETLIAYDDYGSDLHNNGRSSEEPGSSDDDDDDEDELEQLLIKQIVEKTRQGSSLFLDAHLMYSSMGDDNVEENSKY